ncbi:MAG: AbrB/MazE/SpoVT family DNA-binding domain-containing protein [Candidatus Woesearchaeota archaeon]
MTHRRIIKLSPTTNVVSLPQSWVKANNISKGDYVNVLEDEKRLIIEKISKDNSSKDKQVTFDLSELEEDLVWTAIDTIYIMGYNKISLKLTDKQKNLMKKVIKFFPMFIIESEGKNGVELTAVSSALEIDFDKTIQRIRHLTTTMINEGLSLIKKNDWKSLKEIKETDYTLNTYVSMCFRYLSTNNIRASFVWAQFIKVIEQFADIICVMFEELSEKHSPKDSDIIIRIKSLYDELFKLLYNFDIDRTNKIYTEIKELNKQSKNSKVSIQIMSISQSMHDMHEIIFQINELKK